MEKRCVKPAGLYRTALATAIALVLCSPVYAADPEQSKRRDDSTVTGDKLTAGDQSHAKGDVEITRSIRKSLVDDDTLGTNAKNIKVITVDGRVTLRGPVANAAEKARIVAIAHEIAGLDRVQDEIQVINR